MKMRSLKGSNSSVTGVLVKLEASGDTLEEHQVKTQKEMKDAQLLWSQ